MPAMAISLAAMLSTILTGLGTTVNLATTTASPLWWSVIFGATLGGNLAPIGSALTLVAVPIIHRQGIKLSFSEFERKAFPFASLQLTIAMRCLLFLLR